MASALTTIAPDIGRQPAGSIPAHGGFEFAPGIPGNAWPAIPDANTARIAAVLQQLERSQWWPRERIEAMQLRQLALAAGHAIRHVPAYRERLSPIAERIASTPSAQDWDRVPLLTRAQIQASTDRLRAASMPESHLPIGQMKTSGSTGIPLLVLTTAVTRLLWDAFAMREHLWHRRDFRAKLGVIRFLRDKEQRGPSGFRADSWGAPARRLLATGPLCALHIENDVRVQLDWLDRERPDILLTYPSNAVELARQAARDGRELPPLRELRLFSEVVDQATRAFLREAFGAVVTDTYSANEIGYVALQCAEHGRYHVQAENVRVEVLDDEGLPCEPGQTGRVVLSTLHNLAMPLLRYENGDHAEVGEPCPCGRGLPVLARILGRTRNMLTLPDGTRHWPIIGFASFRRVAPVIQHQVVQHSLDDIEVRLVVERPITPDEQAQLAERVHRTLGHPFRLRFSYVDAIERSPIGKYEEFKSLIA